MSFGRNHSKDITFLLRFLLPQRKLGMPLDFCSDSFFSRNAACLFCLPIKSHLRQKEVWSPGSWSLPKYGSYSLVDLFFGIFWCYSIFRSRWFCVWFPKPRSNFFSFKYTGCCPTFYRESPGLVFFLDSWHPEADFERLERQEEAACEASCLDGFWGKTQVPGFEAYKYRRQVSDSEIITPVKTNIAPKKWWFPVSRNLLLQGSIFRAMLVSGRVVMKWFVTFPVLDFSS